MAIAAGMNGSTSRGWRRAALLACVCAIALGSQSARAASFSDVGRGFVSVGEDAFDLIVLRPAGIVSLFVGSVFFVASAPGVVPYHAAKGSIEGLRGSYDVFVYPPYEYTFVRDLGDF